MFSPSSFRSRATWALAAVVAFAVTAAPSFAHPGHLTHAGFPGETSPFTVASRAVGPNMGGFSSPNVEFVKNFPRHTDSAGARKVGNFFYITTERDLTIYDVSKPADPVEVGSLILPDPGMPVFTEEDPDTNGRILLVSNGGDLSVIDVSDKKAPKLLSTLANADDHTVSCVLDCTWVYGSEGTIVDLRDPKKPVLSKSMWKTPDIASFHDVTEVSPGIVLTSTQPLKLLDARADPERPTVLATTPKQPGRFVHANLWPRGGKDDFLLVGGEALGPGCSEAVSASFSTWDARTLLETGATKQIDEFRLRPGLVTEGRAPESSYCVHWFDEHPYYENGGLVAISWYEHGTHFLKIGKDGKITEVGYFLGGGGQASAAYWIDERTVYVADYLRGLDVLRFTGEIGSPPAPPAPEGGGDPPGPQPPSSSPPPSQTPPPTQAPQGQPQAQSSQVQTQAPAPGAQSATSTPPCARRSGFRSANVSRRRGGLSLAFDRTSAEPVSVDVFQQSVGRRVVGERLVARFSGRSDDVIWDGKANRPGRKVTDGYYIVRYRASTASGTDTRRIALRRVAGRWTTRPSFSRSAGCDLLQHFKLERPVFGGLSERAVGITYRVERQAQVTVDVLRGSQVIKRFGARDVEANRTYRLRLDAQGRRGDYRVRIDARRAGERVTSDLVSRGL